MQQESECVCVEEQRKQAEGRHTQLTRSRIAFRAESAPLLLPPLSSLRPLLRPRAIKKTMLLTTAGGEENLFAAAVRGSYSE